MDDAIALVDANRIVDHATRAAQILDGLRTSLNVHVPPAIIEAIASIIGSTVRVLGPVENDIAPDVDTLVVYADVGGTSVTYLSSRPAIRFDTSDMMPLGGEKWATP